MIPSFTRFAVPGVAARLGRMRGRGANPAITLCRHEVRREAVIAEVRGVVKAQVSEASAQLKAWEARGEQVRAFAERFELCSVHIVGHVNSLGRFTSKHNRTRVRSYACATWTYPCFTSLAQ